MLFVDAAHFVYGTHLCCLWTIARRFVRAASGRQRFNVLGAWNAVTRRLLTVTNTTVVNTDTMCQLLRVIAAGNRVGPVTVVLDNARDQRNEVVQGLAAEVSITPMSLPSGSPNSNPIGRLWGFAKRQSVSGKYHPNFGAFRAAIETTLTGVPTTHADTLKVAHDAPRPDVRGRIIASRVRYNEAAEFGQLPTARAELLG